MSIAPFCELVARFPPLSSLLLFIFRSQYICEGSRFLLRSFVTPSPLSSHSASYLLSIAPPPSCPYPCPFRNVRPNLPSSRSKA